MCIIFSKHKQIPVRHCVLSVLVSTLSSENNYFQLLQASMTSYAKLHSTMNKLWLSPTSPSEKDCYRNKLALPLSTAKSKHLTHGFAN